MNTFFQAIGISMIAVVLYLFVGKQNKDFAVLVSLGACCAIILLSGNYLDGVLTFISELKEIGNINISFFQVLLKSVGIGIISEIAMLICADSGNGALGKTIQVMSVCTILWISMPLFSALIDLLNQILGEL